MKAAGQQRLIDRGVARHGIRTKDPRLSRRDRLWHDKRESGEPPLACCSFVVAVVALDEARAATIGVSLLFLEPDIGALQTVIIRFHELLVCEIRTRVRPRQ